jgi:hypothetical protein
MQNKPDAGDDVRFSVKGLQSSVYFGFDVFATQFHGGHCIP